MARSGNLGGWLDQPVPPDREAAEILRVHNFLESLPDAEVSFSGHLVTSECYRLGGCGPGCPPGIRVDAAKMAQDG